MKEDLQAALDALTNLDETKLSEEQLAARAEMVQKLKDAIAALEPVGTFTVTYQTASTTIINGNGAATAENGTASFDLTMRYDTDRPVVTKVSYVENGETVEVADWSNIQIEKKEGSDKEYTVTVSDVTKDLTIEFAGRSPSIVKVVKGAIAQGIVTITPEQQTSTGEDLKFVVEVNSAKQPAVRSKIPAGCELSWEKSKTTNDSNNYEWTLTVKNAPEGTTLIQVGSANLVSAELQAAKSTVIDESSEVNVVKEAVDNKATFKVKLTNKDKAPKVTGDGNSTWTSTYDEAADEWTISCEVTSAAVDKVAATLEVVNANWITVEGGEGVTPSRTKISRTVELENIDLRVVLAQGYGPKDTAKDEANGIAGVTYNTTANDDGSYTVTLDVGTAIKTVKIEAQGALKGTLTHTGDGIKMGSEPKNGVVSWDDKTAKGTVVFDNITVENGYFLEDKPVSLVSGGTDRIVGQTVVQAEDGTWTVTVDFVDKKDIALTIEAKRAYRMNVKSADANITVDGDGWFDNMVDGCLTATVQVKKGFAPEAVKVTIGSASGSEINPANVICKRGTASESTATWQIMVSASLLSGDAYVTLASAKEGAAYTVTIAGDSDSDWSDALGTLDSILTKTTVNGEVSFVVTTSENYIPVITTTEPDSGRTYSYASETGDGDAIWTITFSGYSGEATDVTETIGLKKVADVISKTSALGIAVGNEVFPEGNDGVNIMDFVSDGVAVTETIELDAEDNPIHVLHVSGVINNWIDKTWWTEAGKANGSNTGVNDITASYSGILGWFFGENDWDWNGESQKANNVCVELNGGESNNNGYAFNANDNTQVGFTMIQLPGYADASEEATKTNNIVLCAVAKDGTLTMTGDEGHDTYKIIFDGVTFGTKAEDWAEKYLKIEEFAEMIKPGDALWAEVAGEVYDEDTHKLNIMDLVSTDLAITESIGAGGIHYLTVTGTLDNYITKNWYEAAKETNGGTYAGILGWFFGDNNWSWDEVSDQIPNSICKELNMTQATRNSENGYDFDMSSYSTLGFALINLPKDVLGAEVDATLLCAVVDGGKLTISENGVVKYVITFDVDDGTPAPTWVSKLPAEDEGNGDEEGAEDSVGAESAIVDEYI